MKSLELRDSEFTPQVARDAEIGNSTISGAEFMAAIELDPANWESRKISSTEKAAYELANRTSRPLTNGDFSAGIQGWTAEGVDGRLTSGTTRLASAHDLRHASRPRYGTAVPMF